MIPARYIIVKYMHIYVRTYMICVYIICTYSHVCMCGLHRPLLIPHFPMMKMTVVTLVMVVVIVVMSVMVVVIVGRTSSRRQHWKNRPLTVPLHSSPLRCHSTLGSLLDKKIQINYSNLLVPSKMAIAVQSLKLCEFGFFQCVGVLSGCVWGSPSSLLCISGIHTYIQCVHLRTVYLFADLNLKCRIPAYQSLSISFNVSLLTVHMTSVCM